MRYVQRDGKGRLIGHFANPQPYAQERVADDHPDIVAWDAGRAWTGPSASEREATLMARIEALEAKLAKLAKP
jgi:hypothetical protein